MTDANEAESMWIIFFDSIFCGGKRILVTTYGSEKKSAIFMIFSAFFGRFLLDVNVNIHYNRNDIF